MKFDVTTLEAKKAGSIDLDAGVFGVPLEDIRRDLLHRMVRYQLAKRRAGTHQVKERGEIARTGKKFGRQKGGGGARHGNRRSHIFVGGGVAHGPRTRSHEHELPKKVRRLALVHALSAKLGAKELIVLDEARMDAPKTKALKDAFAALKVAGGALVIGGAELDDNFAKAARNLPNVDVLPVQGINVYDILRRDTLVLTKDAVEALHARLVRAPRAEGEA